MGSILNGIALHGDPRLRRHVPRLQRLHAPGRPAGLAHGAAGHYVWTHDSIGLGEDGPTHQPVEHLTALRAIPGLDVVRPADANETADRLGARSSRAPTRPGGARPDPAERARPRPRRLRRPTASPAAPTCSPRPTGGDAGRDPRRHRVRGAARPRRPRRARGRRASRPGSSRCRAGVVREQDQAYRDSVLPPAVTARVSVEAGIALTWQAIVGDARPRRQPRALRRLRRRPRTSTASSGSPPRPSSPRPGRSSAAADADRDGTAQAPESRTHDRRTHASPTTASRSGSTTCRASGSRRRPRRARRRRGVVGVTTNPSIFEKALSQATPTTSRCRARRAQGRRRGGGPAITTYDVRWRPPTSCGPVYDATDGVDGRVSIEVDPRLAHDTDGHDRRGPGAVVAGRPPEPLHQDPGDPGGPAGDHRRCSPRASASTSR